MRPIETILLVFRFTRETLFAKYQATKSILHSFGGNFIVGFFFTVSILRFLFHSHYQYYRKLFIRFRNLYTVTITADIKTIRVRLAYVWRAFGVRFVFFTLSLQNLFNGIKCWK